MNKPSNRLACRGFTLIEILVVMALIAVLASITLVAINPARQFAQARNAQRTSNVAALLNAISIRIAENRGAFITAADSACPELIPQNPTAMASHAYDIRPCLVPTYLSELPFDPSEGSNTCTDTSCLSGSYDTNYTIVQSPDTGRITVCAPHTVEPAIEGSKPYCLTR